MNEFIDIDESKKSEYNKVVGHPLQSFEWGEFRKKTGVKVIRRGRFEGKKLVEGFTLTLHKVPKTKLYIGYLPKGDLPTKELLHELVGLGKRENCIFIQLEPNVRSDANHEPPKDYNLVSAAHPLFTKYTFELDLTSTEEELLAKMHPKTRYNIRVAEKHMVVVTEDNSENSFSQYLKLMNETTTRQGFYAHTSYYHKQLFETLPKNFAPDVLSYHLFNAVYNPKNGGHKTGDKQLVLTSWVLFAFKNHLYYPYGASSRLFREVMANNLIAWETIKFGKKLGLKKFDMWGALGPEPDKNDPWYGFHRFKQGYGAELIEFIGSYDLVIKPAIYKIYTVADKIRWAALKLKRILPR